jgi:hypothetical protein
MIHIGDKQPIRLRIEGSDVARRVLVPADVNVDPIDFKITTAISRCGRVHWRAVIDDNDADTFADLF